MVELDTSSKGDNCEIFLKVRQCINNIIHNIAYYFIYKSDDENVSDSKSDFYDEEVFESDLIQLFWIMILNLKDLFDVSKFLI